jgi:hypothetical protein
VRLELLDLLWTDLILQRRCCLVGVVLLVWLAPVVCGDGASQISAFVVGLVTPEHNPFSALFAEDPLFTYRAYPVCFFCSPEENRRLARAYYPRTRGELVENYQVMAFYKANIEYLPPRHFHDLDYAFREAGMVGAASPGTSWGTAWEPTVLYHLMPVSEYRDYVRSVPYTVFFRREREPVFTPFAGLGMEKNIGRNYHVMVAKEGSTTWADMRPNGLSWLVSWRPGGGNAGMMWVFTGTFDAPWWGLVYGSGGENPYVVDMLTNLLFHSLDIPLISDIHARREARTVLSTFRARKPLALHVMAWADTFGANVLQLFDDLDVVEKEAQTAMDSYVEQDYEATVSYMESMSEKVFAITEEAVRLKNEAMAWVYASEWLAITGTSLVAGTSLWSLMIRRRLYKQAGSTRLRSAA